ncbi:MAG: hypothetical protein H6634_09045 [Anaerolineales bacterium]|nr:hypothetical protein [Anaerolineales bacterium]MCB9111385.1 hypothetical protein [Anaerolineales bacterium]
MSSWSIYNHGHTIGTVSAEGGTILSDESHDGGARITLKRGESYISVSIHIRGWMDHTRFFSTDADAQREYRAMRSAVVAVLNVINTEGVNDIKVWEAISDFVRRFP